MGTATKTLTNKWFNKPSNDWKYFRAKYLVCKNYLLSDSSPLHWRNLKTKNRALYFTVRSTVNYIPSEKKKIENALQTREILTCLLFAFAWFFLKKNFLKRTIWFPWPSFSQIKTQYNQWLLHFWFLQHSVDGKYSITKPPFIVWTGVNVLNVPVHPIQYVVDNSSRLRVCFFKKVEDWILESKNGFLRFF